LERGVCPVSNLVRSVARATRTVALDWTAPRSASPRRNKSHCAVANNIDTRG